MENDDLLFYIHYNISRWQKNDNWIFQSYIYSAQSKNRYNSRIVFVQSKNRDKVRIICYGDQLLNIYFLVCFIFLSILLYFFPFIFQNNFCVWCQKQLNYISSSTATCY